MEMKAKKRRRKQRWASENTGEAGEEQVSKQGNTRNKIKHTIQEAKNMDGHMLGNANVCRLKRWILGKRQRLQALWYLVLHRSLFPPCIINIYSYP